MIGKYYNNLNCKVNFQIDSYRDEKLTKKQKIKFYEKKIEEFDNLLTQQREVTDVLHNIMDEFKNSKFALENVLEAQRKKKSLNKSLKEAKIKEAERRKTPLKVEWRTIQPQYARDFVKKEEIESFDEFAFVKIKEMGYRGRTNKYEVWFGVMPSYNNFINKIKIGESHWEYKKFSKMKRFATLEEAERFYSEKKEEIDKRGLK